MWKLYLLKTLMWSNTRVMKENRSMAQEIWTISILYPKTFKESYHHIKFQKSIMNRKCSVKNIVLNSFAIFTGKYLCWCLFLNKNAGLQACNFIKKRVQHRCFLGNVAKFLRAPILKNICERLLLSFPFMLVWTFFYMNK